MGVVNLIVLLFALAAFSGVTERIKVPSGRFCEMGGGHLVFLLNRAATINLSVTLPSCNGKDDVMKHTIWVSV